MAEKSKNSSFFIITGVVFVLVAVGFVYTLIQSAQPEQGPEAIELALADEEEIEAAKTKSEAADESSVDVQAALADRILGDPNAPIKMSEHSSFTCGHCGVFHREDFKPFKEAYIDTGKVYLVFSDFPLNAPALHASMAARCLPEDKYFDFVQMLFDTQEDWAYENHYMGILKKKAQNYGLDKAKFESCVSNKELQQGILARQRASKGQWNIKATPSFVINNKTTITGGRSFEELKKIIEEAEAGQEGGTP